MKEGKKCPNSQLFVSAIYSHGKIQQVICAWGKSHGLAHVLNCTSHGSDWLFLFQSGKKVKSHVVPCLITPLTKNKQEHPKRQQIPFHSYLVSVQHSLGQVSAVLRPLQLLDLDESLPMRGTFEDTLEPGPSVTDFSPHDRATMVPTGCLWPFWIT